MKKLKTYLGRVIRDIARKISDDEAMKEVFAKPLSLARLLRQVECPVHGVRIIRLPGNRFRAEITEEVQPVRDAEGRIDVQGTTQAITSVIEGWIRERPEQWLWLHRRWR